MFTNNKYLVQTIFSLLLISSLFSCKKYLDAKSSKSLVVPSSLNDLQALLDNTDIIINSGNPVLPELIADNYYLKTADWQAMTAAFPEQTSNYLWDNYATPDIVSYNNIYQKPVYYANVALDYLPTINYSSQEQVKADNIKGSALFYRSFAFYQAAQLYCRPYSPSASTDPGIILRLRSDVAEQSVRATVKQVYDQITADLVAAIPLLPDSVTFASRPPKAAAYAALARIYLSMSDYTNASVYANKCLQVKSKLINYNSLIPLGAPPIKTFNAEVIYHCANGAPILLQAARAKIDSSLYQSYSTNDLRKTVFFKANTGANAGTYSFQGSYAGSTSVASIFSGLATDEMYLIRAECYARAGNTSSAMDDLNTLMINRWKNNGTWSPFTASDQADAINKILTERRKELVYRGTRWTDLRRFNLAGANITLKRIINNVSYTLPPNDLRWVMLIPYDVINRSGIIQNPR